MQNPPSTRTGDAVEVRSQRWRVVDVRAYEDCRLLTLVGIGRDNRGDARRFLVPFDRVEPLRRRSAGRIVTGARWRRALLALLADEGRADLLRAARDARVDLMPHQLEPAIALVRGRGTRVLLADDVGLGKTIQAALIVAELRARGRADRVLIVTPAGLRDQWRGELGARFGIEADVLTLPEMRRRIAQLPIGINPWTTSPAAIASMDYVKRPEILQAVCGCRWDVVVIDEVHGAGIGTERYEAVAALAQAATYVLLLTATPHSGDPAAFSALCRIGALDDPLLVFRRTRERVGLGVGRRVHTIGVRSGPAAARMHALVAGFAAAIRSEHDSRDAWIALTVLHKRAFSGARALELTVARRLESIALNRDTRPRQAPLPWTDDGGELDASDEPPDWLGGAALADPDRERRLLHRLLDAACAAAKTDGKTRVLARLLRRIPEPIVVFTEYRDTLQHLRSVLAEPVALLHGGLSRDQRTSALDDFTTGRRRVLLATDAAGEGLNLHHRCRAIVNLELPWNPTRLEQRIGRVDRIGQDRRVHVFHLVGRDTGEVRVLERLRARVARAAAEVAASDPLDDDRRTARLVVDGTRVDAAASALADTATSDIAPALTELSCTSPDRLLVDDSRVGGTPRSGAAGARAGDLDRRRPSGARRARPHRAVAGANAQPDDAGAAGVAAPRHRQSRRRGRVWQRVGPVARPDGNRNGRIGAAIGWRGSSTAPERGVPAATPRRGDVREQARCRRSGHPGGGSATSRA